MNFMGKINLLICISLLGCTHPLASREIEETVAQIDSILYGPPVLPKDPVSPATTVPPRPQSRRITGDEIWTVWKYVVWGQGSREDLPW
jgi:hypothetical protein